jgi:DNA polymerase III sliding clamp (beta) subunit (PCNA family)
MYVKIRQEELVQALDKIMVTTSKSANSIPGASAVRIVFKDGGLVFYGRSRNDSIMVRVETEESNGGDCYFGVSCIDLKKLVDTFHFRDESVLLIYDNTSDLQAIPLCVKYGTSMFNLWTLGAEHMSPVEDFGGVALNPLDLSEVLRAIKAVSYCLNHERDNMKGVLVDGEYFVATDGTRLGMYENKQIDPTDAGGRILISPESISRIVSIFKGSKGEREAYALDSQSLTLIKDTICYRTKLLVNRFPNYSSIIPKNPPTICSASRIETLASLDRIIAMSSQQLSHAMLSLDSKHGEMTVSTKTDKGNVEDIIEIEYDGPDSTFRVNARYLVEILKRMQGDRVLYGFRFLTDKVDGIIEISEGPFINFVMPIKDL